jgi:hypothetical protein
MQRVPVLAPEDETAARQTHQSKEKDEFVGKTPSRINATIPQD